MSDRTHINNIQIFYILWVTCFRQCSSMHDKIVLQCYVKFKIMTDIFIKTNFLEPFFTGLFQSKYCYQKSSSQYLHFKGISPFSLNKVSSNLLPKNSHKFRLQLINQQWNDNMGSTSSFTVLNTLLNAICGVPSAFSTQDSHLLLSSVFFLGHLPRQ